MSGITFHLILKSRKAAKKIESLVRPEASKNNFKVMNIEISFQFILSVKKQKNLEKENCILSTFEKQLLILFLIKVF